MKRAIIKIMIISFVFLLLNSCAEGEHYMSCEYQYVNNSGYDVVVSYRMTSMHDIEQFTVKNTETHTISESGGPGEFPRPFGLYYDVYLTFDNSRILAFNRDVYNEDNIMHMSSYELISEEKPSEYMTVYYYQYTFTPEMYERAVPIDDAEQPEIPE